jgi:hypothetical protein
MIKRMDFEQERSIRDSERKRAIEQVVKYFDGSEGALINIKTAIWEGWK